MDRPSPREVGKLQVLPRLRSTKARPAAPAAVPPPPEPASDRPLNWRERRQAEPGGYHETSLPATGLVAAMTALLGIFTSGLAGFPRMN